MNLAKVAQLTQVSPRMLRYYEQQGLLKPVRSQNNYRHYSLQDIEKILKIKTLNDAGMQLKHLEKLLPCFDLATQGFNLCPLVLAELQQQLDYIERQLQQLHSSKLVLQGFLQAVQRTPH
jgi:DNA-binding transcriptional MerR regulator